MAEAGGALEVAGGMLYDAAGAGRDWLLGADEVFWRAILAKASKMDEPFGAGLFCAWFWSEAANPAGGLPGGVVDFGGEGALTFSLNDSIMDVGKV